MRIQIRNTAFKVLILFLFDRDCDEDLCYNCLLAHQQVKLTRKKNAKFSLLRENFLVCDYSI
jgi:hypothetical protein